VGERHSAGAASALVLEGNVQLTEDGRVLHRLGKEGKSTSKSRLRVYVSAELNATVVLEDGSGEDHPLLLVAQKGDGNEEDGKLDLAVLLVAGLFNLHGHVGAFGLVVEGENCTTCEEEVGEEEGGYCVFHT